MREYFLLIYSKYWSTLFYILLPLFILLSFWAYYVFTYSDCTILSLVYFLLLIYFAVFCLILTNFLIIIEIVFFHFRALIKQLFIFIKKLITITYPLILLLNFILVITNKSILIFSKMLRLLSVLLGRSL